MSFAAARESRHARKTCQTCRARKARFRYRGQVRADRDHTLCFECYRAERERQRARRLAAAEGAAFRRPGVPLAAGTVSTPADLTIRKIAHRRAMLAHLERQRAAR